MEERGEERESGRALSSIKIEQELRYYLPVAEPEYRSSEPDSGRSAQVGGEP